MDFFASIVLRRLVIVASLICSLTRAQTAYQSIFTLDAFSLQQTCVQECFTGGYANIDCFTDVLGNALGCPNSPCSRTWAAIDDCYCRGDLQLVANQWLSQCISESCTVGSNSLNQENAESIYSGYCSQRGFTALPVETSAGETTQDSNTGSDPTNTRTTAGSTSSTGSSDPGSSSSSSNNNTLTIAMAALGGVAGIAIIVTVFLFVKIRRQKRQQYQPSMGLGQYLGSTSHQHLQPYGGGGGGGGGSRISDGSAEIDPSESASQVSQPARIAPYYPHWGPDPSMVSSNQHSFYPSTVGSQRSYYR